MKSAVDSRTEFSGCAFLTVLAKVSVDCFFPCGLVFLNHTCELEQLTATIVERASDTRLPCLSNASVNLQEQNMLMRVVHVKADDTYFVDLFEGGVLRVGGRHDDLYNKDGG